MANWYNIEGIEFHFISPWVDFEVTFEGVRDSVGVVVEDTMWERFTEEVPEPDEHRGDNWGVYVDQFADYMRENADEVKNLIRMARGQLEY